MLPYHELTEREQRTLDAHLAHCERCRKTLDSTRRLHALLAKVPAPAVQDAVMREARMQALAAIRAQGDGNRLRDLLTGLVAPGWVPRWAFAAGAMGVLAAVFVVGRITAPNTPLSAEGDVRVTNIRLTGTGDRTVEATFDLVRHVRFRGDMDDPRAQRILASALVNAENPGVRLRAVSGMAAGSTAPAGREVRAALVLAIKTDRNDAVRKEALQALMRYPPDREIRDVLLEVLTHDPNAGLRIAAINGLDSLRAQGFTPEPSQAKDFRDRIEKERNVYVRVKAQSIFEETQQ